MMQYKLWPHSGSPRTTNDLCAVTIFSFAVTNQKLYVWLVLLKCRNSSFPAQKMVGLVNDQGHMMLSCFFHVCVGFLWTHHFILTVWRYVRWVHWWFCVWVHDWALCVPSGVCSSFFPNFCWERLQHPFSTGEIGRWREDRWLFIHRSLL